MRRTDNYDHELSEKLQNMRFAQAYIEALMEDEDGLSVEDALRHTIERMGVKEFSEAAGVPSPNVQEFLKGKRKLKPETLDMYLRPFGLKTRIVLERAS
jgi:DNA-binding phage protein